MQLVDARVGIFDKNSASRSPQFPSLLNRMKFALVGTLPKQQNESKENTGALTPIY